MGSAKVTRVATFPSYTLLENIVVRFDGSILVLAVTPKQLYYLACSRLGEVTPQVVNTFEAGVIGIVELEDDVFYISTTSRNGRPSRLWKLDMRSFGSLSVTELLPATGVADQGSLVGRGTILGRGAEYIQRVRTDHRGGGRLRVVKKQGG
jgi:hypothetical protein